MPVFSYTAINSSGQHEKGLAQGSTLEEAAQSLAQRGLKVQELGIAASLQDPLAESRPTAGAAPFQPPQTGQQSGPRQLTEVAPTQARYDQNAPQIDGFVLPGPMHEMPRGMEGPPVAPRSKVETDFIGPLVGGVALTDLHFFFRQLATMLNAGVGVAQSLDTLSRQSRSGKLRAVVEEMRDHVIAGRPMSAGMQRYPEVFSPLMMAMIRTGEEGGFLGDQSHQLAEYLQRDIELRNLIRRETAYPKIVLAFAVIIIVATNLIIGAVAPGRSGLSSPLTNPAVLTILVPAVIAAVILFRLSRRQQPVMQAFHTFVNNLPGIRGMVRGFAMAKFGRAFGALYKAGVPLPRALELSADASGNEALRHKMYPAAESLKNGSRISESFAETGAFSPLVLDMVKTGEMTGSLDVMLTKVSEYYEDEGAVKAKQAGHLFAMIVFLCVAVYVFFIVFSFWSGYFQGIMNAGGG